MLTLRVVLFLALFWTSVPNSECASAFVLGGNGEKSISAFSSRQEMCYLEGKVLYANACHQLNTQGPCEENERLVLDSEVASRLNPIYQPICLEKACRDSDILWPKDNYCYSLDSAHELCQTKGTFPRLDVFGEGYCDCKFSPPHVRMPNMKDNAPCYPLYSRGQCKHDQMLVENGLKTSCVHNRCSSRGGDFIPSDDGSCHKLHTRGPCKQHEQFVILDDTRQPGCKDTWTSNPLFVVDIPLNCQPDHEGACVEEFSVTRGEQFKFQLLRSAERARKRKKKNS